MAHLLFLQLITDKVQWRKLNFSSHNSEGFAYT